jgi:hypothetical protein
MRFQGWLTLCKRAGGKASLLLRSVNRVRIYCAAPRNVAESF